MARKRRQSRLAMTIAGVLTASLAAGCSGSSTRLPDAASMPSRGSADADRARHSKSMDETAAAASARQTEAIAKIEGKR